MHKGHKIKIKREKKHEKITWLEIIITICYSCIKMDMAINHAVPSKFREKLLLLIKTFNKYFFTKVTFFYSDQLTPIQQLIQINIYCILISNPYLIDKNRNKTKQTKKNMMTFPLVGP